MKLLDIIVIAVGVVALTSLLLDVQERNRREAIDARIAAVKEFRKHVGSKKQAAVSAVREQEFLFYRGELRDQLREFKRYEPQPHSKDSDRD